MCSKEGQEGDCGQWVICGWEGKSGISMTQKQQKEPVVMVKDRKGVSIDACLACPCEVHVPCRID